MARTFNPKAEPDWVLIIRGQTMAGAAQQQAIDELLRRGNWAPKYFTIRA